MHFAKSKVVIIGNDVRVKGIKGRQEVEDGGERPVAAAAAAGTLPDSCYLKPSLMFTIP